MARKYRELYSWPLGCQSPVIWSYCLRRISRDYRLHLSADYLLQSRQALLKFDLFL